MRVIGCLDALLRMTEHAFGDMGLDLELGEAGVAGAPQIVQREFSDAALLESPRNIRPLRE
jgi:hypothetical protein